jgi:hypothetical protein
MKLLAIFFLLTAGALAQIPGTEEENTHNHGNLGAYLDYTRLSTKGSTANLLGFGGRIGFNVQRHIVLEGEVTYDFKRSVTNTITAGGITSSSTADVKSLTGLFGPKIQTTGNTRFFGLVKGGFVNFGVSGPGPVGSVNNQLGNLVNGGTSAVLYPGGGVEFQWGKIGLRAEAGDEIMFLSSMQNNFRAAVGYNFRF